MYDITALGELLIDFTPCGMSEATGIRNFEQNPGNCQCSCSCRKLWSKTAFVGKVGKDMHNF